MHLRIRPNRCWNICWSVCLAHDPGGCMVHPQLPWRGSRHGAQGHQHQQTRQDQHQCSILKNLWRIQKTQKGWDNVANDHHLKRLSFDANNASKLDWAGRSCKRRTVITKRTWNHQSVQSESIHAERQPKRKALKYGCSQVTYDTSTPKLYSAIVTSTVMPARVPYSTFATSAYDFCRDSSMAISSIQTCITKGWDTRFSWICWT